VGVGFGGFRAWLPFDQAALAQYPKTACPLMPPHPTPTPTPFAVPKELLRGSSGECATFASPSLGGEEDFEVLGVELWRVH